MICLVRAEEAREARLYGRFDLAFYRSIDYILKHYDP